MMITRRLEATQGDLEVAATMLCAGDLVAFPTETVYGLGADATNGQAVAGIYAAKQRPSFNPLIVHVPNIQTAKNLVAWSDTADALARAFWPGPLTLVLPINPAAGLSDLVTAGLPSVAVRIPAHPTVQRLLQIADIPVAAPSANPSGHISPTTAQHVLRALEGHITAVVDDGPCSVGLESTIIGLTDTPRLLRPGGLPVTAVEACLGAPLADAGGAITAPGQLTSHYAPTASVRLNATSAHVGECLLGFGPVAGDVTLSASGDLQEAAAALFGALHQLNALGKPIAVAPIPNHGLGLAINDRLSRAAAPRG